MITPFFRLRQDDLSLEVHIRAPHCRLADAELAYEGRTFLFHAKPYFLRLFLPAAVVDSDADNASSTAAAADIDYDSEKGKVVFSHLFLLTIFY